MIFCNFVTPLEREAQKCPQEHQNEAETRQNGPENLEKRLRLVLILLRGSVVNLGIRGEPWEIRGEP